MKYLVTGGAGFIGSAVARRLKSDEPSATVIAIDSLTNYYDPAFKAARFTELGRLGVTTLEADLRTHDVLSLVADVDTIFHLAGQPGVRPSWGESFSTYTSLNIEVTQKLLEAVRIHNRGTRLIYASSSSVYGNAPMYPVSETDLPRPASPYGVTKLAAEHLCSLYSENFSVNTVSLRYFTVFGPDQRPDMAFHKFCKLALDGSPIEIYGDGEQIRDFTYISDVVDANIAAARAPHSVRGRAYNICGGDSISVNGAIDILRSVSGRDIQVVRIPTVAGDVRRTGGDNSSAARDLGWEPRVGIHEGLQREWNWITSVYS